MICKRLPKSLLKNTSLTKKAGNGKTKISKKQKEAIAEGIASFFLNYWKNK
jgi:hypothetical protein